MSAPLSYANHALNLDKNQAMPMARKPTKKAAPAAAAVAAAPADSAAASPPAVAGEATQPAEEKPASASVAAPTPVRAAAAPAKANDSILSSILPEKPSPPPRTYYSGYAMVKAVLSGDTLVLAGSAHGGVQTPERVLTLSGVLAPKFGRGKNQTDEPFAWEAREYLRKHVIGQQVQFLVQHTADGGREYGTVSLRGTDVSTQMLKAGWVRVKPSPGGKDGRVHPEKEALLAVEAEAVQRGVGMHRPGVKPEEHLRTIDWNPDVHALFHAHKNVPLPGVVDLVRDGSTLKIELLNPNKPMQHSVITLHLAGVLCPRTPLPLSVLNQQHERKKAEDANYKGKAPKAEEKAEPFALEAQAYTETRLLHRDVRVVLQGIDKSGNLFGTIEFAKGNITYKLLETGLGRLVAWAAALTPDAEKLKAAEAQAKAQKLRIWADYDESAPEASPAATTLLSEFTGKVVSVPSSDSIVVEDPSSGQEVRVWLASVRAPRLAGRGKDSKDEPFAQEAKEFLRSKLIGHKVRVLPEYVRASPAEDDRAPRQMATIFQNKTNMNEALISAGYAEALQHRLEEERSQFYDQLLATEQKAKEAGRGKFNAKEHVVTRVTDLTERVRIPKKKAPKKKAASSEDGAEADAEGEAEESKEAAGPSKAEQEALAKSKALSQKAKQYLVFLQRDKQVQGVVEFVFSASRFKILVPKEHVMISMSLAGVRTPSLKNADGSVDALAEEILQYVRSKVQQHSVKIEVETIDKMDNFLGSLFINRTNLAVDLLQQGYATIFGFSASKSPYSRELYAAEKSAKEARKGVWANYVEPTPEEKAAAGEGAEGEDGKEGSSVDRTVRITEIVDVGDFYVQFLGEKNAEVIAAALEEVANQPEPEEPFTAPASANGRSFVAAGQFGDDSWHRVRVDGQDVNGDYNVCFIDFGNYDTLLAERLRHLPAEVAKLPPMAVQCALSGLVVPKSEEYLEGSALAFSEMAFGLDLQARVDFTDRFGKRHVTLTHSEHPISLNRQLVRDGWAKVQARPDRRIQRLIPDLLDEQQYAKQNHFNIFEYGDVSSEEEGERPAGPDPAAKPRRGGRR